MLKATLAFLALALSGLAMPGFTQTGGDPFGSLQWPELKRGFFGERAVVVFDEAHVIVQAPAFAEDPMNVPVSVSVQGLADVVQITVIVDRNPIRKVLDYRPLAPAALPALNFRFKLEQASPVRAAVKTRDGVWHVGGTWVDASGGGCTAPGETRRDGSWARTLGEVAARRFERPEQGGSRLRLRVMHPMDTGLVGGIPAFYINRLAVYDANERELLRLDTFEPVSENPLLSFDFGPLPPGPLKLVGTDNNGNKIARIVE